MVQAKVDGLSSTAREESQPALINMGVNSGNSSMVPHMGMSGGSFMTPFGTSGALPFAAFTVGQFSCLYLQLENLLLVILTPLCLCTALAKGQPKACWGRDARRWRKLCSVWIRVTATTGLCMHSAVLKPG